MMPTRPTGRRRLLLVVLVLLSALSAAPAADQPQWGQRHSRNMVSDEKGLPDRFDPKTGENIKWSAAIGTQCWATPVVAGGKVLIGTNNSQPRDPKHEGDRGVLMCLNEADGSLAFHEPIGLRINGESSREYAQKGLRLYFDDYGDVDHIEHDFFGDGPVRVQGSGRWAAPSPARAARFG